MQNEQLMQRIQQLEQQLAQLQGMLAGNYDCLPNTQPLPTGWFKLHVSCVQKTKNQQVYKLYLYNGPYTYYAFISEQNCDAKAWRFLSGIATQQYAALPNEKTFAIKGFCSKCSVHKISKANCERNYVGRLSIKA